MRYAEFRFRCTFETEAFLPRHKGSSIRGLFGHCLKKVSCSQEHLDCSKCLTNSSCIYFQFFESTALFGEIKAGTNVRPHPFVLVPPYDAGRQEYGPGESLDIVFKLFGKAVEWLSVIVSCVKLMGEQGLGSYSRYGQGKFRLESVKCGERDVYSGQTLIIDYADGWEMLDIEKITPIPVKRLEVFFITPLRLKYRNRLTDTIDFQTLIRACCRRIATLEYAYGEGEPRLDYVGLIRDAGKVQTIHADTRWEQVFRYSNRQGTTMNIGGVVGKVMYRGDIAPFWPLLKYCEKVHIGKQTAFGNGRIAVVAF